MILHARATYLNVKWQPFKYETGGVKYETRYAPSMLGVLGARSA
jgi:hypothetical protein